MPCSFFGCFDVAKFQNAKPTAYDLGKVLNSSNFKYSQTCLEKIGETMNRKNLDEF
jgi:hypothetical protein